MKNKFFLATFYILISNLIFFSLIANDQFNFDVTEIEIKEKGNKVYGFKRGTITTDNNLVLDADNFEYDKLLNILVASGDVVIKDNNDNSKIYTEKITYFKNKERIITSGKSKAIKNDTIIIANEFEYNRIPNILYASGNVEVDDKINNNKVFAEKITYQKNIEKIFTTGDTKSLIKQKYIFYSNDTLFLKDKQILSSSKKSFLTDDNSRLYKFDSFTYNVNQDLLKGKNVEVISENFLQNGYSDNAKFTDGFFNLKNNDFIAGDTKINLKKESFGDINNDPRLYGVSSSKKDKLLTVNKATFTSCSKSMDCPAWSINANKIKHDQEKRQLIYDNAILKIYNMPVMYLPKFFHPDPSVKRQSGFLQPIINSSDVLTESIYVPYFHAISDNKDSTFQTTIFEDKKILFQNEYRQKNKNSYFTADFGHVTKYKSKKSNNSNSISHLFLKYNKNLEFKNFSVSKLDIFLEKTSNDTYLRVFDNNLINTAILPQDKDNLRSGFSLVLDNENYQFDTGFEVYENLKTEKNSDRFQYTLPYYSISKKPILLERASFNISSGGSNSLTSTNKLTSKVVNTFSLKSYDILTGMGFKNNLNAYLQNINIIAKKNPSYKSSPQIKFVNIMEANTSLPLIKTTEYSVNYLIPKVSFRFNPSSMKDESAKDRGINVANIFNIDRVNLSEGYESGKSLTLGLDYTKKNLDEINKYFSLKLGTVLRDDNEDRIPKSSTLNRKTSNLFGSIENSFSDSLNIKYDFSIDNDYNTFDLNTITTNFIYNNFNTSFQFYETNGERGDANAWSNRTSINLDDTHSLTFGTRRNRKISLTEYYDLVYNYKNDCLTAGFKYKKTYYEDRDIQPKEDLLLTITIKPITTYEHKVDQDFYRD